jgi:hypothetical protein
MRRTAKMGVDADAVVDNDLRVHGLRGLRVADASVMPSVIAGPHQRAIHHDRRPCRHADQGCLFSMMEIRHAPMAADRASLTALRPRLAATPVAITRASLVGLWGKRRKTRLDRSTEKDLP